VRAQVEVLGHAKVLEGIVPDLVLCFELPGEDVEVFVLGVVLEDALDALLVDGALDLLLGLPEGEVREFLVDEESSGVFLDEVDEGPVVDDAVVLVVALDLVAELVQVLLVFSDELVLVAVAQHLLDGFAEAGDVVGDAEGQPQLLNHLLYRVVLQDVAPVVGLAVGLLELLLDLRLQDRDRTVVQVQVQVRRVLGHHLI
jgi:hypothetical protein